MSFNETNFKTNNGLNSDAIVRHNPAVPVLYEDALQEKKTLISSTGALAAYSGEKTGRLPKDKRIVDEETSTHNVWWGPVNRKISENVWKISRERAKDYLRTREKVYVVDAYAGWDPKYRLKIRVVCARAYHAIFMRNMLIRPTEKELETFGEPDFTIWNAGQFPANIFTDGMTSTTSVEINFKEMEMVILGTEYAGEMKKGIFTVMFYLMPINFKVLTLHSSCNQDAIKKDVTLFFGLSGTGKTTLSADPNRMLIGDDEHCWSDDGVFNIEGGCYAKCIGLSKEKEPDIYNAIKYGSVLENIGIDLVSRIVDYNNVSITENTRCAYPIEYIPNAKIPCIANEQHPLNIILLTCDAHGVLPAVLKLTPAQVMYHFISGYTSKVAGTEQGITKPETTFSSCYGQPFLALHPMKYAQMLSEKMAKHKTKAWLLNTGWIGKSASDGGKRCPLKYTRAILDSIHDGSLAKEEYEEYPIFGFQVPKKCGTVAVDVLNPLKNLIDGKKEFMEKLNGLAKLFCENFKLYQDGCTAKVVNAGPVVL